jgi:hypothetical protein
MNNFVPDTREQQLSQLLNCTVEQLDITPDEFVGAEQRYLDVGKHLAEEGADIYVQGSFLLGTVISPYGRFGEYDLDLVCHSDIAKTSITQQGLKDRVGGYLADYLKRAVPIDSEVPELGESRRCWTLGYKRFHMDVLPAIPDAKSPSETAILLTDKQLWGWQPSDPLAYVAWFRQQCARQFEIERAAIAKEARGTVDDVPEWRVRTPLHRVVQVLKRHRDVYFADDLDARTPSSLITTLAARGYRGEQDLLAATIAAVQRMPGFVEDRDGVRWVVNPVCPDENFADKWDEYPDRRLKFVQWLGQAERDLESAVRESLGVRAVHQRLEKAFGETPVRKAVSSIGERTRLERERGGVRVTTTGALTTGTGAAVRDHRFFGGPTPT